MFWRLLQVQQTRPRSPLCYHKPRNPSCRNQYFLASPIADVNGLPISPTRVGNGADYSTNQWLFGGVVMIGATYLINPTWFLDLNYSYVMTETSKSSWGGPWMDTLPTGATRIGHNLGTSSGSANIQAFSVAINAAF